MLDMGKTQHHMLLNYIEIIMCTNTGDIAIVVLYLMFKFPDYMFHIFENRKRCMITVVGVREIL